MTKRDLQEFVKNRNPARECVVCGLSPAIQKQIRERNPRRVTVAMIIEWLKAEYGLTITLQQWLTHANGRHWRKA